MAKLHTYKTCKVSDLIPYANNSRTHSEEQTNQVASSIKEFGFTNPVLIDEQGGIVAGHGRILAAKKLGLDEVPCIELNGLTEAQKKAYVIADNQLALNSGWDLDMLKLEVDSLKELDFDIDLLGFNDDFLDEINFGIEDDAETNDEDNPYSMNIEAPTYEPGENKPVISELISLTKTDLLVEKIKRSNVSGDEKRFLTLAAERHSVFDFGNIADYYAHANEEMQDLMEQSALVIIDYNKALENGFVKIAKALNDQYEGENNEG